MEKVQDMVLFTRCGVSSLLNHKYYDRYMYSSVQSNPYFNTHYHLRFVRLLYCLQHGILFPDYLLVWPIRIPQCAAVCHTRNKLTACSFFSFFCSNCSICENSNFYIISKHAQILHAAALDVKAYYLGCY